MKYLRRQKPEFIKKEKRNKYVKGCMRKWRFRTSDLADKHRFKLSYGESLNVYLCEFCGWWHLGRSDQFH